MKKILQLPTRTFCRHFFSSFSCFKDHCEKWIYQKLVFCYNHHPYSLERKNFFQLLHWQHFWKWNALPTIYFLAQNSRYILRPCCISRITAIFHFFQSILLGSLSRVSEKRIADPADSANVHISCSSYMPAGTCKQRWLMRFDEH